LAVRWSEEITIRALLRADCDVNTQNSCGGTALMMAVEDRNESIVRLLVEAGANPNLQNNCGSTALIWAGNPNIARVLVDAGANPQIATHGTHTPLKFAIDQKNNEVMSVLIDSIVTECKSTTFECVIICSICCDVCNESDLLVVKLECGHYYHKECINEWLRVHNTCPYCRSVY